MGNKIGFFLIFPIWKQRESGGHIARKKFFGLPSMFVPEDHNSFTDLLDSNLQCATGTELKSVLTLLLRNEYTNLV